MNDDLNREVIRRHEGCRLDTYRDTVGKRTVGVGFNLDAPTAPAICQQLGIDFGAVRDGVYRLTEEQADRIFAVQYARVRSQARVTFPDIDAMPDEAAAVICDMIFNLGYAGFLLFRKFIEAMKAGRWAVAIAEMEDSHWAKQVSNRVKDDVELMEKIGADPVLKG